MLKALHAKGTSLHNAYCSSVQLLVLVNRRKMFTPLEKGKDMRLNKPLSKVLNKKLNKIYGTIF